MKLLLTAALAAFSLCAQVASKPEPISVSAVPSERDLTPSEIKDLTLANAQIEVLRARFKVDDLESKIKEFQAAIGPIYAAQEALAKGFCLSVGVPEDKIKTGGCGLSVGVDAAGQALKGQDGKAIPSKVWAVKAQSPVMPSAEKK